MVGDEDGVDVRPDFEDDEEEKDVVADKPAGMKTLEEQALDLTLGEQKTLGSVRHGYKNSIDSRRSDGVSDG